MLSSRPTTSCKRRRRRPTRSPTWMQQRYYWGDFLAEMRRALIRSEDDIKKKLSAQKPGVDVGIWIEQITSAANQAVRPVCPCAACQHAGIEWLRECGLPGLPGLRMRGESIRGEMPPPPAPTASDQTGQAAAGAGNANTNTITLICRAVSLTSWIPRQTLPSLTRWKMKSRVRRWSTPRPRSFPRTSRRTTPTAPSRSA